MKMRTYIATLLLAGVVTGCSLEEEPYGFTSTENFYKTAADATSAIVYAYSILPEIEYYSRNFILVTELPTENVTLKPDAGASEFEIDGLRPRADNEQLTTSWRYAYIGINRANAVIANVPGIGNMEATYRNHVVGEAYFLRALHYFNLVRLFGEAPVRTTPVTSLDQINSPKSSIQEMYNLIIADLENAAELMDMARREGRVNKVAAWGMLAKVYVTLASAKSTNSPGYDFVMNADEMYASAKAYSEKVLYDQSLYSLDPSLKNIFDVTKEDGPEHIFSVSTDRTGPQEGNFSKLPLLFIPSIDGAVFRLEDGTAVMSGWNHLVIEPGHYNSYAANDKRKTELIISKVIVNGTERNLGINDYSRPFTRKFLDPGRVGEQTSVNTPVLRFSDVMLLYAEASGPTAEGYEAMRQIRERAGLGQLQGGLSPQQFRNAVIQERAWELAFEGHRLFDLRRTNKMEEVLVNQHGKAIESGAYFFDIPQREVDANPNL
ncbi:RagB/SusD family nutrient uptake outer membrane protein [Pontibacter sp. SGAir0037]|uniref:RagB/SusD family nutrient uptake outer membrane protein n=1 Tax=Pontibacter sp. SGAir0037 TaxID=2571030 RepID=UPI0010CD2C29|nr:RagB/SusD family nutrient uptake outer membrane protein [Pontibacter sp. SGAir0037]QCR21008.1 RagB/SusD family nutrient uptake outer membrane protein [Pontibacter sp. SGAir0037]